jgi:hypothetical protein
MYRVVAPLAVLAMAAAVPASAQDAGTSQPAEKPVKEKKICKSDTGTGSIMPKRTCRTKAEWAALTEQSKGNLERSQKVSGGTGMVGVNGQ